MVLITPEAKATLEAEAERAGASGDVVGGLLFGYPLDERRRLIVGSVRPRTEVNFGKKGFCLDQSRTSQQLADARKLDPKANYCGVWYVHRTPTGELTDDEWVQAQRVLEDPDFSFKDLVCLVVCLYAGDLNTYALSFNLHHAARGQLPASTLLKLTTEAPLAQESPARAPTARAPDPANWYKAADVARRMEIEHKWLAQKYHVESAVSSRGKVVFRLMPRDEHQDMAFCIACEHGFPDKAPTAFLVVRGDRYPLLSPDLSEWSADMWLVQVADGLVKWQVHLLDQQVEAAEEALNRGNHKEASDLLAMVLLIDPRKPGAARLLARAPALMKEAEPTPSQATSAPLPSSPEPSAHWYKSPAVADRLKTEHERLSEKYRVEPTLAHDGELLFRLMPKAEHEDMVFYLACRSGYPDEPPVAFLSIRGDRYPLLSPGLNRWSPDQWLADMADELVEWQVALLDQQMAAAKEALDQGDFQEASDILAMVLLIDPRKPGAARLLAQVQARVDGE
jgi:hypothetical protein